MRLYPVFKYVGACLRTSGGMRRGWAGHHHVLHTHISAHTYITYYVHIHTSHVILSQYVSESTNVLSLWNVCVCVFECLCTRDCSCVHTYSCYLRIPARALFRSPCFHAGSPRAERSTQRQLIDDRIAQSGIQLWGRSKSWDSGEAGQNIML